MEVIVKPIITEKMTSRSENLNQYGFIVHKASNKLQIKKAVEDIYGVEVLSVNTMNYRGKSTMRYTKGGVINGKKPSLKKAIVTLVEGEVIDFYSNI